MNILDEKDNRFYLFQRVVDARIKERLSKGSETKVRQADPILPEDEEKLWNQKVFGIQFSLALQYTVFLYYCKLLGLYVVMMNINHWNAISLKSDVTWKGNTYIFMVDRQKPTMEAWNVFNCRTRTSNTTVSIVSCLFSLLMPETCIQKHFQECVIWFMDLFVNLFVCVLAERCLWISIWPILMFLNTVVHFVGWPLAVGIRYGVQVLRINTIKGITGQAGLVVKEPALHNCIKLRWMNKRSWAVLRIARKRPFVSICFQILYCWKMCRKCWIRQRRWNSK